MASPLKKLWVPGPEVAALMQESIRAAKSAALKSGGVRDQVMVLSAIRDLLNAEMMELLEDSLSTVTSERVPAKKPVCVVCNDTHRMKSNENLVMCTRCPTPCQACRSGGIGPYCEKTPCPCSCHPKGA